MYVVPNFRLYVPPGTASLAKKLSPPGPFGWLPANIHSNMWGETKLLTYICLPPFSPTPSLQLARFYLPGRDSSGNSTVSYKKEAAASEL